MIKPLSKAQEGEKVRIKELHGGSGFCRRISTMGICKDMIFKVITNYGNGPVIVEREGFRVAIGWGMANKILVEPVLEPEKAETNK